MKTSDDYAVIELGGMQYPVQAGDLIEVNKLSYSVNQSFIIDEVLLRVSHGSVNLGKPYLTDKSVSATLIKHYLGTKVVVAKFKAKTGYRRKNGFRPSLCQVRIEKLN